MGEAARTRTVNVCVLLTDLIDADNAEPGLHRTPAKRTRLARPSVRDHQKRGSTGVLWDLAHISVPGANSGTAQPPAGG
jgi:hypothetical protein